MRFHQWIRLRRKPPPRPPTSLLQRVELVESEVRRHRTASYILYAVVIVACACSAAAALYALQAGSDASSAVTTAEAERRERVADQAQTNRRQCIRQREYLKQLRTTKRIEATSNDILLRTIERLLAQRSPTRRSSPARLALQQAAIDLRSNIATLKSGEQDITLLLNGDPGAPKGSAARRGVDCRAPVGRPLQTG